MERDLGRYRGGIEAGLADLQQAALRDGVDWSDSELYTALLTELEGLIEAKLDPEASTQPREKTIRWYIQKHHEPLTPGLDMTVLQACYWTMYTRHYGGLNERVMNQLCGVIAIGGLLSKDNLMPR